MQDKGVTAKTEHICAVVVTFNRKALLEECLTALLKQTRRLDEIIVIDNASTDGTDELMKTKFSGITYVKMTENMGGSYGFHEGMKLAYEKRHDWIWVMDDDTITQVDALEKLLDCPVRIQEKVYALASTVLNWDETIFPAHRRLFDAKKMTETIIGIDEYTQDYFQMDTASFVGMLLSRKAIEEVGLPLKDMFIYFDDTEYSLRIRKKGIMLTVPASRIVHGEPGKVVDNSPWGWPPTGWKKYYGIRNRIYTYRKHGNPNLKFYLGLFRETYLDINNTLRSKQDRAYNIKLLLCAMFHGLRGKLGKNAHFLPG
ncbi:MAG: glycosyltransferase family 2 protein [Nitrososphaerota archaeon]|nr:glycosyltransferase family 2 protein [Nitrososphaerota archaeon]